ncbi:MAG: hypothetical protein EBT83_03630 [Betaproteobacteria bacterium]|nr:hypothetical protein [Betaproteobacteria bacterium]
MRVRLISLLVANVLVAVPFAFAAEGGADSASFKWSGDVSFGARGSSTNALDPSKFRESRDVHSTAIGIFDIRGRGDDYYMNAFGENIGRDDQYLDLKGGKYGVFKYQLYGNDMRHNFGSGAGALTPFSGVGTSNLTAPTVATGFANRNPGNWNGFDNSYKRQDIGGMFEFSNNSPWYIRTDINEVKRDGIKVLAGSNGTSPGQGFVDLPSPVDFKTTNFSIEGGYASKRGQIAASWLQSRFTNANPYLNWTNPYLGTGAAFGVQDTSILPPSNDYTKIGVNGTLRQLPLGSSLAGRLSYSNLTNDVPVLQNILSINSAVAPGTPTNPSTVANQSLFKGDIVNKTASLSLTSHPLEALDTRLYWNWIRKDNNSTAVTFSPPVASGLSGASGGVCSSTAPCTNELFNYRKQNVGLEAGYRLNPSNKVSAGFDFYSTERERPDSNKTNDRKYFAEWKSSPLDTIDTRVKYQYLDRSSNFLGGDPLNLVDQFVRKFDVANVQQHQGKLVFDYAPLPLLDLGFEAIYKQNSYNDTPVGRTKDGRQEYYASISYGDPQSFRVMVFGDIELAQYDSLHRVGTGNPDPNAPPSGTGATATYTWAAKNLDRSYQAGFGADWLPSERWVWNGSLSWAKTQGSADFSARANVGAGQQLAAQLMPIQNFDNTTKATLNLKGTYKYSKNWNLIGGYAFERYRFSDIGYENFYYAATPAASTTCTGGGTRCNAYMTGQSAYQNYNASILYLFATYKY